MTFARKEITTIRDKITLSDFSFQTNLIFRKKRFKKFFINFIQIIISHNLYIVTRTNCLFCIGIFGTNKVNCDC